MESIRPRDIWKHEALDFTPWLNQHLSRLGNDIGLELKNSKAEVVLSHAGRADIIAHRVDRDTLVVIENQLEPSDDDHCLRLIGYAAEVAADTLLWIASRFESYHLNILEWLNATDQIDIYAIIPEIYRINGSYGLKFHTVIKPSRPQHTESHSGKPLSLFASRLRPIVERLRREGMRGISPRDGGWAGRYRSFSTGYEGIVYGIEYDIPEGEIRVNLNFSKEQKPIFETLHQEKETIEANLEASPDWSSSEGGACINLVRKGAPPARASDDEIANAEEWIVTSLLKFREIFMSLILDLTQKSPSE